MENIEFISVMVRVDGYVDASQYGWGSVTLEYEGRSYILDVCKSNSIQEDGCTIISLGLKKDVETHGELTKYDLTAEDLILYPINGTIFIGDEYEDEPEFMTLFVRSGGMTKAIDLIAD